MSLLGRFWCNDGEVAHETNEYTNVLPICPDAHDYWDRFFFALRPIRHPTDSQCKMYIQMAKLQDVDTTTSSREVCLVNGPEVPLYDTRRAVGHSSPQLQHGDVFEIVTDDPIAYPLPSYEMLSIQYACHKILAGIKAAGALRVIFRGDPPEDPGEDYDALDIDPIWRFVIEEAEEQGILSVNDARAWIRTCAQQDDVWRRLGGWQPPSSDAEAHD